MPTGWNSVIYKKHNRKPKGNSITVHEFDSADTTKKNIYIYSSLDELNKLNIEFIVKGDNELLSKLDDNDLLALIGLLRFTKIRK